MINPATQHIILKIVGFLEATELVSGPVTQMALEPINNQGSDVSFFKKKRYFVLKKICLPCNILE